METGLEDYHVPFERQTQALSNRPTCLEGQLILLD